MLPVVSSTSGGQVHQYQTITRGLLRRPLAFLSPLLFNDLTLYELVYQAHELA